MFSHIMVGANDLDESRAFYDALLGAIGVAPGFPDDKGRIFWMTPTGVFAITKPLDGESACCANGGTIGFSVPSPEAVDAWHAAGVAHGGTPCEDPPGERASPLAPLYLAYLRDPAGNKLCGLHRLS
jgi:catechol 2,3-dioxygenase-like lactoylglutathione lyase family enzyme